ncbi:MAG: peptidylprolyl isomerase [Armatimonadota bacterium]|nr:peptidylprolyl isomerase [bacterium]
MRNRMLVLVMAALILALSATAFAADTKAVAFDQDAALQKLWNAPDSAVVGSVNGSPITKGEVLKALWFWNAPSVLKDLLNQKMIWQAANKANVKITPDEMKAKIDESLKRMNMGSVDQLLNQYQVTRDRFMTGTKISALAEKIVTRNVKPTDAEYAEYIKAQHILIKFPSNEKDKAKQDEIAKQKADEVYAKAKAGEDFSKLADEYSEDPGNVIDGKKQGGNLGWFTKGRMVQEFEKAAFALKAGEISEPVKTFYGYHIIKVEKIGKDATPEEKIELNKMIMDKKVPMEMGKWFQELQGSAKIDNKLMAPESEQPKPKVAPKVMPKKSNARPAPKVAPPASGSEAQPAASEKPETPPPPPPPADEEE